MVRGEAVFLILTVFIHINIIHMGSVFDKFTTPEKKDKNKMLMYLRGLLKIDTTTTARAIFKGATVPAPGTLNLEEIWDKQGLPDRSDKSKMLAYLRGMKAPSSMYSVYEAPQHQGLIQTLHTQDNENPYIPQNPAIDQNNQESQKGETAVKDSEHDVAWGNPATQMTILRPAEKEGDSDTCFWRGQQPPQPAQSAPAPDHDTLRLVDKPDATPSNSSTGDIEQVGEKVIAFFECVKTKFWKSYAKIQTKICGMFQ